jgi:hypothetical protein
MPCGRQRGEGIVHSFFTTALDEGKWSASNPGPRFTAGERTPGPHLIGGWVSLRAGLDKDARGKFLSSAWDRTPVVQYVVRYYIA